MSRVVEISQSGRAPKNDPALFVLALAAGWGNDATRAAAFAALPAVARTGTHLFHWLQYVKAFRGWGRGVRNAVGRWYTTKSPVDLVYQLLKYQSRAGWSHRDALRLAHARPPSVAHDLIFRFVTKGWDGVLELDVSGSMVAPVHGLRFISCREASATVALVTAAREPSHRLVALTRGNYPSAWRAQYDSLYDTGLTPLAISPRQRLDDVVRATSELQFGGTDCALPMVEALKNRWAVDAFVIYTDSETWAGSIHPVQALRDYRERMGIAARLVVVAMASNGFSIADPDDAGMLDVVGFDAATPQLLGDFIGQVGAE